MSRFIEEGAADSDIQIVREHAEARLLLQRAAANTTELIRVRHAQLQRGMQHGLQTQIPDGRAIHRVEHLQTGEHDAQSRLPAVAALQ